MAKVGVHFEGQPAGGGPGARLDEKMRLAFSALTESPERIAALLARMAFHDRVWCELASSPSVAYFKEALQALAGTSAGELLAFEKKLQSEQSNFRPSALWLAWVVNNCQPAIEAIRTELKSWVSAETATPSAQPPAVAPKPPRAATKLPAKPPAPPRRVAKKK